MEHTPNDGICPACGGQDPNCEYHTETEYTPGPYELACGCKILTTGLTGAIDFCPLHKAAPDLLWTLQSAVGDLLPTPPDECGCAQGKCSRCCTCHACAAIRAEDVNRNLQTALAKHEKGA